jgi:hypothetical protein
MRTHNIYKDYYFREDGLLYKKGLQRQHLLWKKGGVPCVNANLFDKLYATGKLKWLGFKTDKQKFLISAELFNTEKEVINLDKDKQYTCDHFFWNITPVDKPAPKKLNKYGWPI